MILSSYVYMIGSCSVYNLKFLWKYQPFSVNINPYELILLYLLISSHSEVLIVKNSAVIWFSVLIYGSGLHGALGIGATIVNFSSQSAMQTKLHIWHPAMHAVAELMYLVLRFVKCAFDLGYFQFITILLGHNPIVSWRVSCSLMMTK